MTIPPLDPSAAAFLQFMAGEARKHADAPKPASLAEAIAAGRRGYRGIIPAAGDPEAVAEVRDVTIPGPGAALALRLYRPEGFTGGALLFLHGGGFVSGGLDTHDTPLRRLANRSKRLVVAVDYRLAPEHPYPAALDDAMAALRHITDNAASFGVDAARIAVGGDSAGGLLAATLAIKARDGGGPAIERQALVYPNTDLTPDRAERWPSVRLHDGKVLRNEEMTRNAALYVGSADAKAASVSPVHADDLARLPPAIVVIAGNDPLSDEGTAYADKLASAKTATDVWRYPGQVHGFFQLGRFIPEGNALMDRLGDALR